MVGTKNEIIKYLLEKDDLKKYEIKEFNKNRTRNQNSYYYKLLNELAKKMKIPSKELHFKYIKECSPFVEVLIPIEADTRSFEYHETKKILEKDNKQFKVVKIYTASHLLDTIEMGILLDSLIEDCKDQGINTITPEELAIMRNLEND